MGNYASCALAGPTVGKSAKVISPATGEIRQFSPPITAGELMIETPNHFVVNSKSMKVGKRFSAMNADEDLEVANVYVMFPMQRKNSFVTGADMGALFMAAKRSAAGKVRVVPACSGDLKEVVSPAPATETEGEVKEEMWSSEMKHRMSVSRSKKPLLETIVEEPLYSR